VTASSSGALPTDTVAVTVFVAVEMTLTVLLPEFATYAVWPFGLTATPWGFVPTPIVAITVFVRPEIALTDELFWFAT
jgi:hypothetical protein